MHDRLTRSRLDLTEPGLLERLAEVQRAAYLVEAAVIGDDRIPPLHETPAELGARGLNWLGAFSGSRLVGAIAWSEPEEIVDIERLVVAPEDHRRGIATALISDLLDHAAARRVVVSTGRDNGPARRLYEAFGFTRVEDSEPISGLWLSRYELVR